MSGMRGGKSELLIDHRAAGQGYVELATLTCAHCNTAVVLHPERKRARNACRRCMAYVCDRPGCIQECTPFAQTIDILLKHPNEPVMILDQYGFPIVRPELRERERIF